MRMLLEVEGKRDAIKAIETLQDYLKRCTNIEIKSEFECEIIRVKPQADDSLRVKVKEWF